MLIAPASGEDTRADLSRLHPSGIIEQPIAGVMHKRVELGTLALCAAYTLIHKFVAAAKALAGNGGGRVAAARNSGPWC
jgi:hypothetical protein